MAPLEKKSWHALITGGAGFIGSHLARELLDAGAQVSVIDDLSTGKVANISPFIPNPRFRFEQASILESEILDSMAAEATHIFHLAAAVGVQLVVEDPLHTIETNISGTESVLKAAVSRKIPVLMASTSEVYGKSEKIPFSEDDDVLLGSTQKTRWSYAASKMLDEFLGLAYHRQKGLPVTIFRLFNTVGPGQSAQYGMVVARFVEQALKGEPITIYGDGQQTRCFCDVHDAVGAILRLSECSRAPGQVFNVGSTHEISIEDLAKTVWAEVEKKKGSAARSSLVYVPYEKAYAKGFEEIRHRKPNIQKIKEYTGWEPKIPLAKTLQSILERN
ncbi:MAG: GDP-mannose 4,6-dehydratase [bacterium]